jgi:hypothetical protein
MMHWSPAAGEWRSEPTTEEILADPIVRALMQADKVDPEALEEMLRFVATKLRDGTGAPRASAATSSAC